MIRRLILLNLVPLGIVLTLVLTTLGMHQAAAQGLFAPARKVNDRVISNYDVDQRIRFLQLLNVQATDMRREALERLTEEAVQRDHARRRGIRAEPDDITDGMAEFARRADLSTDEFIRVLGENGVDRESFVSFVEAGILWRRIVQRDFPALVEVTDSDVNRARDVATITGRERLLISEIFLPTDPEFAEVVGQIIELIEQVRTVDEFARLAREFSLAGSREQGGRVDWIGAEDLPGEISELLRGARQGQVVGPLELGGAIAYFMLRARESSREIPPDRVRVRYTSLLIPAASSPETQARLERIRTEVRHCEGLGRFGADLPEEALREHEGFVPEIPAADAMQLARLDRNEISTDLVQNNTVRVLMLCSRELQTDTTPSRSQSRNALFDRRVGAMADVRLQELIADAEIRDF